MKNFIVTLILLTGIWFFFKIKDKPSPAYENTKSIDTLKGLIAVPVKNEDVIQVNKNILKGVIPKKDFECSGVIFKVGKDRQPGVDYSVCIVNQNLAKPEVIDYLISDGRLNKTFQDGFVLDTNYFQSHTTTFYMISANNNLKKAMNALKPKDKIAIKGFLVYLNTDNGIIQTSLDPKEFKCKYAYITEIVTDKYVFK